MRRIFLLILLLSGSVTGAAHAQSTQPLTFVSEYVRELAAYEDARARGEKDIAEKDVNPMAAIIRSSTRMVLELGSQIEMLKSFHLDNTNLSQTVVDNIIDIYRAKIELYQRTINISEELILGPNSGIDYGKLTAEIPKLTARLEFLDKTLFEATPLVFAALISPTPDKDGHMSRLVITKAERVKLVRDLDTHFGDRQNASNMNYIVSSAKLLKSFLHKGYKCADEP